LDSKRENILPFMSFILAARGDVSKTTTAKI
jgi:hypothetical protein